jgi:hypothetical protein
MPDLDPATGYPPGYVPGWWKCPGCKTRWHDRQDRGRRHLAWDCAPECGDCRLAMERVLQPERGERPRTPGARVEVEGC